MTELWLVYECTGTPTVPLEQWGKDHWSTFAYLETVAVDKFGHIDNRRMRTHPRLHRELCGVLPIGGINDGSAYPTRLKEGVLEKHDDWSCLEDMVAAGLITAEFRRKNQRVFDNTQVHVGLTDYGYRVSAALRMHKASGGNYSDFTLMLALPAPVATEVIYG